MCFFLSSISFPYNFLSSERMAFITIWGALNLPGVEVCAGSDVMPCLSSSWRRAAAAGSEQCVLWSSVVSWQTMAGTLARKAVDHLRSREFREYLMRSVTGVSLSEPFSAVWGSEVTRKHFTVRVGLLESTQRYTQWIKTSYSSAFVVFLV